MRIALATLLVVLLSVPSEAGQDVPNRDQTSSSKESADRKGSRMGWLIVGMIAAQAADIVTTSVALRRGCTETMYYGLQNKWAIGGMKAGGAVVLSMTLPVIHNKRPKLTRSLAWGQIASGALGAAINASRLPQC